MRTYWTNFAKRGLPAAPGTPAWPFFNGQPQTVQLLVTPDPHTETDFATTHNCAFWAAQQAGWPQYGLASSCGGVNP
ncbi:hypothetical protein ACH40F_56150 [Streptomyces sp. NPDC020794]|uniref:hypothetical protein n=1 Tax=unclassified Streptomyces TaxID=2593676 RepID=UPI0036E1B5B5